MKLFLWKNSIYLLSPQDWETAQQQLRTIISKAHMGTPELGRHLGEFLRANGTPIGHGTVIE